MKRCKWCREEIIPSKVLSPWRHVSGAYTCSYAAENMAEPADERWEKVWASVGPPDFDIDDPGPEGYYTEVLQFRIEVVYEDMYYWVVQRIHKQDIAAVKPEINVWKFLMNEMVSQMDERLPEEEHD